jgi:hypothetical protein
MFHECKNLGAQIIHRQHDRYKQQSLVFIIPGLGQRLEPNLVLPHRYEKVSQRAPLCQATPSQAVGSARVEPPESTGFGAAVWLEPYPDALLEGAIDVPLGPEPHFERTKAISLAFVAALQLLPPRQLAVLILRDVLGFHAQEVADMLDSTVESVNSALKRARASLQRRRPPAEQHQGSPAPHSPSEQAILADFVSAWESADLDALVAILTDDVFISMSPMPLEYEGRDVVARYDLTNNATGHVKHFRRNSSYEQLPVVGHVRYRTVSYTSSI